MESLLEHNELLKIRLQALADVARVCQWLQSNESEFDFQIGMAEQAIAAVESK